MNPAPATELSDAYFAAIHRLPVVIAQHPDTAWTEDATRAATACIALARGQRWYAKACLELDHDTASRWFREEFGWDLPA